MKTAVLIARLGLVLAASVPLCGSVTVTGIVAPDQTAATESTDVVWSRVSGEQVTLLKVATVLADGDELECKTGTTIVDISTSETAHARLVGKFHVILSLSAEGRVNFINLASGSIDAIGNGTAPVRIGNITFGPSGTHYAVTVNDESVDPGHSLDVFDGAVVVSGPELRTWTVQTGQSCKIPPDRKGVRVLALTMPQIVQEAQLLARIETSSIQEAGLRTAAQTKISGAYAKILQNPASAKLRQDLVEAQVQYQTVNPTSQYQLSKIPIPAANKNEMLRQKKLQEQINKQFVRTVVFTPAIATPQQIKGKDAIKYTPVVAP